MALFDFFRLKRRCGDLEDRVQSLESGQKALELEWESVYDTLRRLAGKISRRAQADRDGASIAESASTPTTGAHGADLQLPGLDERSARIRASRHGNRTA